jgi:hypothetical protein
MWGVRAKAQAPAVEQSARLAVFRRFGCVRSGAVAGGSNRAIACALALARRP